MRGLTSPSSSRQRIVAPSGVSVERLAIRALSGQSLNQYSPLNSGVVHARAILTDMACPIAQACRVAGPVAIQHGLPAADIWHVVGGSFFAQVTIVGNCAPRGTA